MTTTEKNLNNTFKGETTEVGLYLAMSKQAEREGHPDIAVYLRQIAMDEAWHAVEVAEALGMVGDTKSNLEMMLKGETMAEQEKARDGEAAVSDGHKAAASFFSRASRDEGRHKAGLAFYLKRFE